MPHCLRMHGLRYEVAAEAGRLLCVLLLRLDAMPAGSGGELLLLARAGWVLVRLPLHAVRLCWRLLNFVHVSVVYSGHLPIVPGDRDRIPTRFGDNAAVSGIAPPINAGALLEGLGFVDCHCCSCRYMSVAGRNSEARSLFHYVEPQARCLLLALSCLDMR